MKETVKAILKDTMAIFLAVLIVILYFVFVFCLPLYEISVFVSNWRIETLLIILYAILAAAFTFAIYEYISQEHIGMTNKKGNCSENPNRWIPVRKKPPEEDGQYLITVKYKHIDDSCEDVYTEHGKWSDGKWDMSCFGHYGEVEDIIAWKPLPEPYKPTYLETEQRIRNYQWWKNKIIRWDSNLKD